ncbi:hypothetical protein V6Z11_D06G156900 [Gossypium hirsutum]
MAMFHLLCSLFLFLFSSFLPLSSYLHLLPKLPNLFPANKSNINLQLNTIQALVCNALVISLKCKHIFLITSKYFSLGA